MADFGKALRPGESVRKSAGISGVSLLVMLTVLVLTVFVFRAVMNAMLNVGAGSEIGASMAPINSLMSTLFTVVIVVVFAWAMLKLLFRAMFTQYGLTDSRVLRKSFLRVRGADLIHVQDVEVSQSLLGKMFGYGDVLVRTASTDGTLVLHSIAQPHEWFREISDSRR